MKAYKQSTTRWMVLLRLVFFQLMLLLTGTSSRPSHYNNDNGSRAAVPPPPPPPPSSSEEGLYRSSRFDSSNSMNDLSQPAYRPPSDTRKNTDDDYNEEDNHYRRRSIQEREEEDRFNNDGGVESKRKRSRYENDYHNYDRRERENEDEYNRPRTFRRETINQKGKNNSSSSRENDFDARYQSRSRPPPSRRRGYERGEKDEKDVYYNEEQQPKGRRRQYRDDYYEEGDDDNNDNDYNNKDERWEELNRNYDRRPERMQSQLNDNIGIQGEKGEKETKKRSSFFSSPFKRLGQDEMVKDHNIPRISPDEKLNNEKNNHDDDDDVVDMNKEKKQYNPIDYQFPTRTLANDDKTDEFHNDQNESRNSNPRRFSNPRRDEITIYTSTKTGKLKLAVSTASCGGALGAFIGKSTIGNAKKVAILFAFMFWFMGIFLRDAYGEMVRSVGLGVIYLLNRTRDVRKRYPTRKHVKAMLRLGVGGDARIPFPPITNEEDSVENPWKYTPTYDVDPEFDMVKTMVCIVMIGSFCGGSFPLIPTWMGSTAGAATFAFMGISKNARGDLLRTMGMRIVSLASEAITINSELNVARKVMVVAGKLLDKALILDRKHRIKDRVVKGASWAFTRVNTTVRSVQNEMNQDDERGDDTRREDERGMPRRR